MSGAFPLVKGKVVPFKALEESWNYYSLSDGTVLGVKVVVAKVVRIQDDGGKDMTLPDGTPVYSFQTQNVTAVLKPDEYKDMKRGEGV